jgi:hypothetical protein
VTQRAPRRQVRAALAVIAAAAALLVCGCTHESPDRGLHMTVGAPPDTIPRFTVPFEMLEPYWSGWSAYGVGGKLGLYMKKAEIGTVTGVDTDSLDPFTLDGNGIPVAPTRDGSIIYFDTGGMNCGWLDKMELTPEGRLVFRVVAGRGLVHVAGKGVCTLEDGSVTRLE